ncbi:TetR/AcrR family transcriptional regulator [Nonomuraea sp. NPDC047897]|uniref:TetR/AcrR family transcriptional regulator n=1 Tax=Nonomuraea sp. NPDC047897 TaxID=3364346 RepID=UPI003717C3C9
MDAAIETGTRARTRRAILDAALSVLADNPTASLADIASAAGVGRTTIHRYFRERSDLLTALGAHLLEQVTMATERARLHEGTAVEALDRLCQELFELGDGFRFSYEHPQLATWADWDEESEADRALVRLIERGHADGTIDPRQPAQWVTATLWAMLYAAWTHSRDSCVPRHTALQLCLRSFRKSIAPGDP